MVEEKVIAAGGHVHWARDAEEAKGIVLGLASAHGVRNVVKVKSMVSEEIALNPALEARGIRAYETDLGEFIVQLAGQHPSHITAPALHMTKEEIADLFRKKLGVDARPIPEELTELARQRLRREFLDAGMGISGGNFLIAETGTLVIVTNEGNGRLSTSLPPAPRRRRRDREGHSGLGKRRRPAQAPGAQCQREQDHRLQQLHHRCPGWRPEGISPRPSGQRPVEDPRGRYRPGGAPVHPLRGLHEHLPGVQPGRRLRLRGGLPGPYRGHADPPDDGDEDRRRAALCLHLVRGLRGALPGDDPHPRDPPAPPPALRRRGSVRGRLGSGNPQGDGQGRPFCSGVARPVPSGRPPGQDLSGPPAPRRLAALSAPPAGSLDVRATVPGVSRRFPPLVEIAEGGTKREGRSHE